MKKSKKIPAPVAAKIKTVIPSYPGAKKMQKDLVSQSLAEGVSDDEAWFDPEWRLKIKKGLFCGGSVSDYKIEYVERL